MNSSGKARANWPLCLDSFNVVFREDQANCQFALPSRRDLHFFRMSQDGENGKGSGGKEISLRAQAI
jgi:hypothetical protein